MPKQENEEIVFKIDLSLKFLLLEFVLFFPEENRWDNNRGRNYRIELPSKEIPMSGQLTLGGPGA